MQLLSEVIVPKGEESIEHKLTADISNLLIN